MSQDIWTRCGGKSNFKSVTVKAWRVVENQYQNSTRKLVDSLDEHDILEQAIENVKPPLPHGQEWRNLHFLLITPFRYSTLETGSRFGVPSRGGLWYGSRGVRTALAEAAYYRLRFLNDSKANLTTETEHTVFFASTASKKTVDLCRPPFQKFRSTISDPSSYKQSQRLGTAMRDDGVEMFLFHSARDPENGVNIGVFSPKAFKSPQVKDSDCTLWRSFADKSKVEFSRTSFSNYESFVFPRKQFEVDGIFPAIREWEWGNGVKSRHSTFPETSSREVPHSSQP